MSAGYLEANKIQSATLMSFESEIIRFRQVIHIAYNDKPALETYWNWRAKVQESIGRGAEAERQFHARGLQ